MKTIEITVSPTGETKLQTKGFTGSDCIAASKDFECSLGLKNSEVQTPEFFEQAEQIQNANHQHEQ